MEPITREVYLAVLSMLGVDPNKTREVHLNWEAIEIEEYTEPRVFTQNGDAVTARRVVPVLNNGYTGRPRD